MSNDDDQQERLRARIEHDYGLFRARVDAHDDGLVLPAYPQVTGQWSTSVSDDERELRERIVMKARSGGATRAQALAFGHVIDQLAELSRSTAPRDIRVPVTHTALPFLSLSRLLCL